MHIFIMTIIEKIPLSGLLAVLYFQKPFNKILQAVTGSDKGM